jgi:hypothetical protein
MIPSNSIIWVENDDIILTLIGPLGPMDEFDEYMDYWDRTIQNLTLEQVVQAVQNAHTKYARWPEDIECLAIKYIGTHPEDWDAVSDALIKSGFEVLTED